MRVTTQRLELRYVAISLFNTLQLNREQRELLTHATPLFYSKKSKIAKVYFSALNFSGLLTLEPPNNSVV